MQRQILSKVCLISSSHSFGAVQLSAIVMRKENFRQFGNLKFLTRFLNFVSCCQLIIFQAVCQEVLLIFSLLNLFLDLLSFKQMIFHQELIFANYFLNKIEDLHTLDPYSQTTPKESLNSSQL